jgi:hypothetical protein
METLWYTEPSGDRMPDPSADQLIGFMRQDYDLVWGPYSPVGVLAWHEHQRQEVPSMVGLSTKTQRQQLLFVRHPEQGWYFEYDDSDKPEDRLLVPLDPAGEGGRWIKHWACGEPMHFLAASFVPQSVAEQVVAHFISTKKPWPVVFWVPFDSIRPRLDVTEYREHQRQAKKSS